jgi:thioredoxin reductase
MAQVAVVGGGAAGLSAALFTAKNGLDTVVFDTDETWMHKAHLFNYLGIDSMDGSEFIGVSREQVEGFGADIREREVTGIVHDTDRFVVTTTDGERSVPYLVLATGADRSLAEELGCDFDGDVVDVNVSMETSVADAYATGGMVRDQEWQAIISAGDGGAAALDILSKEEGEHFHDFDTPADAE